MTDIALKLLTDLSSFPSTDESAWRSIFSFHDVELLATLLDDDAVSVQLLAQRLLRQLGLQGLARELVNDPQGLQRFGLSCRQITRLAGAYELMTRCHLADYVSSTQIWSADDAAVLFQARMKHLDHEELHVLALDIKMHVLDTTVLYKGTVQGFDIRVGEIMGIALRRNCPALLIAHNHPSGDPTPSAEDLDATKQILAAARVLDLILVDHLIIGNPGYVSLKSRLGW